MGENTRGEKWLKAHKDIILDFLGHVDHQPKKNRRKSFRDAKHKRRKLWLKNPHCNYCNKELLYSESTLDHVIPVSKGGKNKNTNLVLACKDCNTKKSDQSVNDFLNEQISS